MDLWEGIRHGYSHTNPTISALGTWLTWNAPGILKELQEIFNRKIRPAGTDLSLYGIVPGKEDAIVRLIQRSYLEMVQKLNGVLRTAAGERFQYAGISVQNPFRFTDSIVKELLSGIDFVKAIFRKRGVPKLLHTGIKEVILAKMGERSHTHGLYQKETQTVYLMWDMIGHKARSLKNWINEVFLHEFGHYIHLNFLPTPAKQEWDSGWAEVDEARDYIDHLTGKERKKFFSLIQKNHWNPQRAGRKLKGIQRIKFLFWLHEAQIPLISSPNQVRLTPYGVTVFQFFQDPEAFISEEYGELPAERFGRVLNRRRKAYLNNLYLGSYGERDLPIYESTVQKILKKDPLLDKALDKLEIPTQYGRSNVKEDFAETFVRFMTQPESLSDLALHRMKRTLWMSGFYGKSVLRLGKKEMNTWENVRLAREVLARYRNASNEAEKLLSGWYSRSPQSPKKQIQSWFEKRSLFQEIEESIQSELDFIGESESFDNISVSKDQLYKEIKKFILQNYGVTRKFAEGFAYQIVFGENY